MMIESHWNLFTHNRYRVGDGMDEYSKFGLKLLFNPFLFYILLVRLMSVVSFVNMLATPLFDNRYFWRRDVSPDLGVCVIIVAHVCGYCTETGVLLLLLMLLPFGVRNR